MSNIVTLPYFNPIYFTAVQLPYSLSSSPRLVVLTAISFRPKNSLQIGKYSVYSTYVPLTSQLRVSFHFCLVSDINHVQVPWRGAEV